MPPTPSTPIPQAGPQSSAADSAAELAYARQIIAAESRAVSGLAERLGPAFHEAVELIYRCAAAEGGVGNVLVSGVGKSGLVGAKISATFTSLGVPSHFVHPTEAAHGDLGNFRRSDICLALSYSGETDEVVSLAHVLRQDHIAVIAITAGAAAGSTACSSLARASTVALSIGRVEQEAALSPAPTVSMTAMLALGDALALCASRRLNFSHDDFLRRHPGGSLGGLFRPVTEALRFIVGKNVRPVPDDVTVAEALALAETGTRKPGATLLVDRRSGLLTGLFTDGDLHRLVVKDASQLAKPIANFMTRSPATLSAAARLQDAVHMVQENRRDEIPIIDADGRPVGILDVQDLMAMRLVQE